MGLDAFLGNQRIKDNLTRSIARGRISHFYLLCGPAGSGKRTLARLLAAAILCQGSHAPCGACDPCRKVLSGAHPDFITVDDPEKKYVPVELIRRTREELYVRPNEAARKLYLLPRAQDMRVEAQNALLKVLEEPPEYAVFILLTDNPEKLLPTVRSRCTELRLESLPEGLLRQQLQREFPGRPEEDITGAISRSGGFLGPARELLQAEPCPQTQSFAEAYARKDQLGLIYTLVPMEKWKRDQLIPVLEQWNALLHEALLYRSGMAVATPAARAIGSSRSPQELCRGMEELQKCISYAQGNASVGIICGYLVWKLR